MAELARNGIPTGVLIAPLMPGINDDPRQVEELLGLLGEAGAESVGGIGLHLRGEVREIWFDWLRQYRPDLVERYGRSTPAAPICRARSASGCRRIARGPSGPRRFRGERRRAPRQAGNARAPAAAAQSSRR